MRGQIVHTETEIKTTPNYPGNTTAQPAISVKPAWYDPCMNRTPAWIWPPLNSWEGVTRGAPYTTRDCHDSTNTLPAWAAHWRNRKGFETYCTYTHGQGEECYMQSTWCRTMFEVLCTSNWRRPHWGRNVLLCKQRSLYAPCGLRLKFLFLSILDLVMNRYSITYIHNVHM